ncbi:MAG: 3-carboxy-cis,cis-muconate cycloisomerase [Rhizobiaceae bacterium]
MSFTPFNAHLMGGLFGDREAAGFFSIDADLEAIKRFEVALFRAQARNGFIPTDAVTTIEEKLAAFEPDKAALAEAVRVDGVAVPRLVAQMRAHIGEPHSAMIHKGSTSQDAVDTSLMLRLMPLFDLYAERLDGIVAELDGLAALHGDREVMARTRFQCALPISLSHKIAMWSTPLKRLKRERPTTFPVQLGGPEGALAAIGETPEQIVKAVAKELGLAAPPVHWQTDRWPIADVATWIVRLATALGKIGFDVALMAQNEIGEVAIKGGGGSSAMPHKNNPVLAESLVTLARFVSTQMDGLNQAFLHENERSGISWSLEWMLVPALMVSGGASLRNAAKLLRQLEFDTV